MTEGRPVDPLVSVRPWGCAGGATVELHARYLNYDVADEVKSLLEAATRRLLDSGHRVIVLDLSSVSVADSCGVGLVIGLDHEIAAAAGVLWIAGVSPFLRKIFGLMRLEEHFHLAASEAEVRRRLGAEVA